MFVSVLLFNSFVVHDDFSGDVRYREKEEMFGFALYSGWLATDLLASDAKLQSDPLYYKHPITHRRC